MFLSNLAESQQEHITLSGVEAGMVALLLDYAYTSTITITETNVQVTTLHSHLLSSCVKFSYWGHGGFWTINEDISNYTAGRRTFIHGMTAQASPKPVCLRLVSLEVTQQVKITSKDLTPWENCM